MEGEGKPAVALIAVGGDGDCQLAHLGLTDAASRLGLGPGDGGHQQGNDDHDEAEHDKQFDEAERPFAWTTELRHTPSSVFA